MVHADIEIEHDEDGGLQAVGEIEGLCGEFEGFGRVFRKQHHMLGVAMGSIGAGDDVTLLGARRHAGRWTGALHVHDHGRHFGEIRQADKFRHQRDAGPGGGGEGARAVPRRADHDANRSQFVLALHDGVFCLAGFGIVPQLLAVAGKGVGERR